MPGLRLNIIPTDDGPTDDHRFESADADLDSEVLITVTADTWGGASVTLEISANGKDFAPIYDSSGNQVVATSNLSGLAGGYGWIRGNVTGFAGSSGLKISGGE